MLKVKKTISKILLCVTEDWFALSHFRPLIETLVERADHLVLLTNVKDGADALRDLGADVRHFDFSRSSLDPLKQTGAVRRLTRIISQEHPDVVHCVSLQTMVVGALAARLAGAPRTVYHLTGAGFLVTSGSLAGRILKPGVLALLRNAIGRPGTMLLVENSDDAALLSGKRKPSAPAPRIAVIPGAGVDPESFPEQPATRNDRPVVAFVGRMLRSKGVAVLAEATHILQRQGNAVDVSLYGSTDVNPDSIPASELERWDGSPGVPKWNGPTKDIAGVWRKSDICIMAPLVREGMPRAMLEAASCGRPLIVSDVPGCRHFVSHEVEGLIVPPGDAAALADAITRLVHSPGDAQVFGRNARQKLVAEYSTDAVKRAIKTAYLDLIAT